ncbi:MAG: hypothetical protein U0L49_11200 [Eubacterium sp.]|nr:hypothetical protein [Eubacterium sp.]
MMKAKKIRDILCIVVFLLMIGIPLAFMNVDPDAISAHDNRALAGDPIKAHREQGISISYGIEKYVNDRIGFREKFINFNNVLTYKVFHASPARAVMLGKEEWLFYDSVKNGDGDTIGQYTGQVQYTEEQLKTIADNLTRAQKKLEARGTEFIVMLVPNKERFYPEYLPDAIRGARISDTCNTDQLVDYLRKNTDIRLVWCYDDMDQFRQEHPEYVQYCHLDTHWNNLGAYVGAKALFDEMGIDMPEPLELPLTEHSDTPADLLYMMNVDPYVKLKETDYALHVFPNPDTKIKDTGLEKEWIYTNHDQDERKVLFVRDSCCAFMRNVLGAKFNYIDMVHFHAYKPEMIEEQDPDVFIYEMTERTLDRLLYFDLDHEGDG